MSSLLLTKFFDEGAPSNSPGWQKMSFVILYPKIFILVFGIAVKSL